MSAQGRGACYSSLRRRVPKKEDILPGLQKKGAHSDEIQVLIQEVNVSGNRGGVHVLMHKVVHSFLGIHALRVEGVYDCMRDVHALMLKVIKKVCTWPQ